MVRRATNRGRMWLPRPHVSCWPAEMGTWTTFPGITSFMVALAVARVPGVSSRAAASLQTENLWVKCDACGASRSMAHAFGKAGKENLPACRGRHPHLDLFEVDCNENARAVSLGATNSWFPITLSALASHKRKTRSIN